MQWCEYTRQAAARRQLISLPGIDGQADPDRFYPVPNRAMKRAARFGGVRADDRSFPARSRIQRGNSRPSRRGTVIRHGVQPIFVDPETGDRMDMAEFTEQLEQAEGDN